MSQALWSSLCSRALSGRANQPDWQLPPVEGPLGALLQQLNYQAQPEQSVLRASALLSHYQRVGRLVAQDCPAEAPPIATQSAQPAPLAARREMQRLLKDDANTTFLLIEWLEQAAARGYPIPASCLPRLFSLARQSTALGHAVTAAMGAPGRWLASQNPQWNAWSGPEQLDQSNWLDAGRVVRLQWFSQLLHAEPAHARTLLRASWEQHPAKQRSELLALLGPRPVPDDQAWLESLLNDRSKEVRTVALGLLRYFPDSTLQQARAQFIRQFLEFNAGGLLSRASLTLGDFDSGLDQATWQALQLPEPIPSELEQRVSLALLHLLPALPLSSVFNADASVLLKALEQLKATAWPEALHKNKARVLRSALLHGWLWAALVQGHGSALPTLLQVYLGFPDSESSLSTQEFFPALGAELTERYLGEWLHNSSKLNQPWDWLTLLDAHPGPWSLAFSQQVLEWLIRCMQAKLDAQLSYRLRHSLRGFAQRKLHPHLSIPHASEPSEWQELLTELQQVLTQRLAIQQTFA